VCLIVRVFVCVIRLYIGVIGVVVVTLVCVCACVRRDDVKMSIDIYVYICVDRLRKTSGRRNAIWRPVQW
jgi:hypothetical protein